MNYSGKCERVMSFGGSPVQKIAAGRDCGVAFPCQGILLGIKFISPKDMYLFPDI